MKIVIKYTIFALFFLNYTSYVMERDILQHTTMEKSFLFHAGISERVSENDKNELLVIARYLSYDNNDDSDKKLYYKFNKEKYLRAFRLIIYKNHLKIFRSKVHNQTFKAWGKSTFLKKGHAKYIGCGAAAFGRARNNIIFLSIDNCIIPIGKKYNNNVLPYDSQIMSIDIRKKKDGIGYIRITKTLPDNLISISQEEDKEHRQQNEDDEK